MYPSANSPQSVNQGYPPSYPPPTQGYPPPGGYPPQGGYPPPQGGYPPPQGGYPQGGHPQGGYSVPQGYPPVQGYYGPPPPGMYPPPAGHGGAPITHQPGPQPAGPDGGWMNMPQGGINCPPGLEYLTMIDQLLVKQKVEVLEALTGFETKNKFTIKNSLGQKVYYAVEDSDCCTRNICGSARPFDMKVLDNFKNEVIHFNRPLACDSCCFPCCLQSMEVSAPPGNILGTVQQEWSLCYPSFTIRNATGETVLRIEGPLCTLSCCGDVDFKILSRDGETQVGKISKQWSGVMREMFTDSDYFGITFPIDLDVKVKAILLGACFLIDVMYFERTEHNH